MKSILGLMILVASVQAQARPGLKESLALAVSQSETEKTKSRHVIQLEEESRYASWQDQKTKVVSVQSVAMVDTKVDEQAVKASESPVAPDEIQAMKNELKEMK